MSLNNLSKGLATVVVLLIWLFVVANDLRSVLNRQARYVSLFAVPEPTVVHDFTTERITPMATILSARQSSTWY